MSREIRLSGGEITLLKALGTSGTPMSGQLLLSRMGQVEEEEFIDTLRGLMDMDYVVASKVNVLHLEDVGRCMFRVNPIHSQELRDALRPGRRRDDEDRGRRQRRR